jgi:hypothetical protein
MTTSDNELGTRSRSLDFARDDAVGMLGRQFEKSGCGFVPEPPQAPLGKGGLGNRRRPGACPTNRGSAHHLPRTKDLAENPQGAKRPGDANKAEAGTSRKLHRKLTGFFTSRRDAFAYADKVMQRAFGAPQGGAAERTLGAAQEVDTGKTARLQSEEELLKFFRCKQITARGEVQRMHKQTVEERLSEGAGTLPGNGSSAPALGVFTLRRDHLLLPEIPGWFARILDKRFLFSR